ncbi:MAG: class I SAM-dependent methyltransferase [Phycisphaeraceae bacterium]|nr:class I SAM-dependent methyltransferase [Phycisphaeraceae bacterium]
MSIRFTLAKALTKPKVFRFWERLGLHVTPVHFYQPIPDTRELGDDLWGQGRRTEGLTVDLDAMGALAEGFREAYADEYDRFPVEERGSGGGYFLSNKRFETVDAEVCYSFVRSRKPRRIIEVGSGFSTLIMLSALDRNASEGRPGSLTTIDPYPFERVRNLRRADFAIVDLPVQRVELERFEELEAGDVLFIDSSHVACIGSDVTFEILDVLPRMKPGVLVHVHDIFLPREYPRRWVMQWHRFWNEQYMLQAFLAFNSAFRVVFANHWMHVDRPETLRRCFASYKGEGDAPGSIWIERTA